MVAGCFEVYRLQNQLKCSVKTNQETAKLPESCANKLEVSSLPD